MNEEADPKDADAGATQEVDIMTDTTLPQQQQQQDQELMQNHNVNRLTPAQQEEEVMNEMMPLGGGRSLLLQSVNPTTAPILQQSPLTMEHEPQQHSQQQEQQLQPPQQQQQQQHVQDSGDLQHQPAQLPPKQQAAPALVVETLKEGISCAKRHDENTETWRWVIHNISHAPQRMLCEPFTVGGYKWRILFFPQGNGPINTVSMYLDVADAKELPPGWSRYAEFGLSVVNLDDFSRNLENESERRFNGQENDWGFRELAPKDKVYDQRNGFYRNDTLVLEATVKVRKEAHLTNPANYDSKRETGFVGLRNQGATCYLNSLLQTLYHIPEFRRGVYRMPTEDCENPAKSIPLALQRVFWRLQFNGIAVDTKELTQSFGWDTIDSFMQHDVQELARVLCDNLEEKMKQTAVEGTIPRLFKGEIKNYIKCVNIDFESTRVEPFYDLQLNVKGCNTIYDSFDKYVEIELLNGDNRYHAEGHGLQDAKKGSIFTKLPPVLMLHLKRFEYDFQRDAMYKINDHYQFDLQIDLNKYVESPVESSNDNNIYSLFSVLVHSGDVSGGHYYAFVHPYADKGHWFKFDDDKVFHVLEKDAVEENFGGDETRSHIFPHKTTNLPFKRFSNAYMLVYIRSSDVQHILKPVADEDVPVHLRTRFEKEKDADDRRRREKAEAHKYVNFRVITDNDIYNHDSCELVPIEGAHEFRLRKSDCPATLKQHIYDKLNIPVSCQRFWKFEARQNRTFRPDAPVSNSQDNTAFERMFHLSSHAPDSVTVYLETAPGMFQIDEAAEEPGSEETQVDMQVESSPVTSPEPALSLPPLPQDSALLFFKFFDPKALPGRRVLRYVGSHVCSVSQHVRDLFPTMRSIVRLPESKELLVYEEVKPSMIEPLDPSSQLRRAEIQHGDILVFQCAPTQEENGSRLQLIPEYYSYLFNRRTVRFSPLNDPDPTHEIQIELQRNMTFDEVVEHLGAHIHVPANFIRLTGCNPLHPNARSTPFKTTDVKILKDMLHAGQGIQTDRLFFEVLDIPLRDLENKRSLQVCWFNSKVEEVTKMTLLLHKDSTVHRLTEEIREALHASGHLSDFTAPIRVMEVWQSKIIKIFAPEDRIEMIYPPTILRAEEVLEETDSDPSKGERVIQIQHFCKESLAQYRYFGHPFFLAINKADTGAEVRKRVQQKLAIPDEEFEQWKFGILRYNKPEYIQDDENVPEAIRKLEKFRFDLCFGFEHKDTSARSSTRWYDKAIKIYN